MTNEEQKKTKEGSKFCFKCGTEIFEEAEICPKCGVRQLRPLNGGNASPGVAVILSFLWPGLGHLYLGDIVFGLVFMFLYLVLWGVAVMSAFLCSPIPIIIWIWAMYDSYNLAKKINRGEVE